MKLSQYISIFFSQLHIEQNVLDNLPQYNIEMSSFDAKGDQSILPQIYTHGSPVNT